MFVIATTMSSFWSEGECFSIHSTPPPLKSASDKLEKNSPLNTNTHRYIYGPDVKQGVKDVLTRCTNHNTLIKDKVEINLEH